MSKYKIIGMTSLYEVLPAMQNQKSITINPATYKYNKLKTLIIVHSTVLL